VGTLGQEYLRQRGNKGVLSPTLSPVPFVINNDGTLSAPTRRRTSSSPSLQAAEKQAPLEDDHFRRLELGTRPSGLFARYFPRPLPATTSASPNTRATITTGCAYHRRRPL